MAELSKEAIAAIENYGNQIKTLKDFVTAVRKRPGYHIGAIGSQGFKNMGREIAQNAVDQIVLQACPCQGFNFFYDERSLEITVEDINGLGIPFDQIIRVFNTPNTSKNYEKRPYEYSSGMHGAGAKVVNALSSVFTVESYKYDGSAAMVEFEGGYPKYTKPKPIPNKTKKQGTKVSFIPDTEIMGDINLPWKEFYILIKRILSQTQIGSFCNFTAIDIKGVKFTETIKNEDGIITELIMHVKDMIIPPIIVESDDGYHRLQCAFTYDAGGENGPDELEQVTAFSNFCETIGGYHIKGTIDGICRWFSNYMNNIVLINQKAKDKLVVKPQDIKVGLRVMISAAALEAVFDGQAKNILSNVDMEGFCKEAVMKGLDAWSKQNPADIIKLSKFFKDIAENRQKNEEGKAKIATKYSANPVNKMPRKYMPPLGKDHIELIIVEGNSAMSTVQLGRDRNTQGIFPIRGKIINAFKYNKAAVFSNEEVQAINQIMFGTDYRRNFTVEECRVEKIIFLADGDVDGSHISALLERLFVMYYPQLIRAGMVYKAIPPLLSVKDGKKTKYFTEQVDIIRYNQKLFLSNVKFSHMDNKPFDGKDTTIFFMTNQDYIYYLEKLANTYAINPYLLEKILYNYIQNGNKVNTAKLNKEISSLSRFISASMEGKTPVISGTIDMYNLVIVNDKFLFDCRHIIDIINKNSELFCKINGEMKSLYQTMKCYESFKPSNIKRYKGLGEMNKEQLAESALYPGSDRTLIRYTMEDTDETLKAIREYETDTKKILSLVGNVTRADLLD